MVCNKLVDRETPEIVYCLENELFTQYDKKIIVAIRTECRCNVSEMSGIQVDFAFDISNKCILLHYFFF